MVSTLWAWVCRPEVGSKNLHFQHASRMLILPIFRVHFENHLSQWHSACSEPPWKETMVNFLHSFPYEVCLSKRCRGGLWEENFVYSFGKQTAFMPCILFCWKTLTERATTVSILELVLLWRTKWVQKREERTKRKDPCDGHRRGLQVWSNLLH